MTTPASGRTTLDFLIQRNRLEYVDGATAAAASSVLISRATRRLLTADAGHSAGDPAGAFSSAYDAYRMAAECLLVAQGLRSTGGDGSHMTVEDAVAAQYGSTIAAFAKPTFERFRRTRHAAQYFDPSAPEIDDSDTEWAIATARKAVTTVALVLADDPPGLYPRS